MRRTVLLPFLALCLLVSCDDANKAYVRKAVRIMDKHGLYAEGLVWATCRDSVLALQPKNPEDAQDIVRSALKVAGGKHSFLQTAEKPSESLASDRTLPSLTRTADEVLIIALPHFSGSHEQGKEYADAVLDSLSGNIQGVVLDLRGNTGGNMYPMIAAVHRFLPDDAIIRFRHRRGTTPVSTSYVNRIVGVNPQEHIACPVAVLTDSLTGSSGEAVLICFRGLDNVCVFGSSTAGYASCNATYALPGGSLLILTIGCDVARTGEVFCDEPIRPDVETTCPLEEALNWIRRP